MVYTVIKHCLTGSLFAVLTNRRNLCFFPVNIRARPLTGLHEISTARDWFQILLCPNRTHTCFLRDGTFLKFPQSILTANLVHMAFFNQLDVIKTSSKPQLLLKSREGFLSGQNFQNFDFWGAQNFLRIFLPLVPLGSASGLNSGRGSRGFTPLHWAALNHHDSVVQRLLEAKAAVDAQNKDGHGLGGGCWGEISSGMEFRCEVDEMLMVQVFRGFCVSLRMKSVPVCQDICTNIFCLCTNIFCLCRCLQYTLICFVEIGWNKDFWVGLCSWVGVYVLVYYPRHFDCQNPKATVFSTNLMSSKHLQNHNVPEV